MGCPDAPTDPGFVVRDAVAGDLESVLRLNGEWDHVTSPLILPDLVRLHSESALHRVVEKDSRVLAFLLAFAPGADYDSPNYRWFDARFGRFLYVDRVVVSSDAQRAGLGAALYRDVFAFAEAQGIPRIVCEVDVEPMNAPSDAFHRRWGFVEVGTQYVADGKKRVSLRERVLAG